MRIALSTGGGDAPGLNAVIRAAVLSAVHRQWEVQGIRRGFAGLLGEDEVVPLTAESVRGIAHLGGTILGSTNRGNPFRYPVRRPNGTLEEIDRSGEIVNRVKELGIDAIITIGGDGSMAIAQRMHELGIKVVGVPKTIDNDVGGTVLTFGFASALDCITLAIDKLHTTAESHGRVMVVEVMGRYAGWLALYGGIAGGADVILIPEIPFRYESIVAKIREREAQDKRFTMVVIAEGAHEQDKDVVTATAQPENREARLGGVGAVVAAELERRTRKEARTCVLGHLQRGGTPSPLDRALCSMFGTEAMELVAAGDFGKMVSYLGTHVGSITIAHAVRKLKTVPPDGDMARTARALGVCLGDE